MKYIKLMVVMIGLFIMNGCSSELNGEEPETQEMNILAIGQSNMKGDYCKAIMFKYMQEELPYKIVVDMQAVNGSSVEHWQDWLTVDVKKEYNIIMWHQGESDTVYKTSFIEYYNRLRNTILKLRITNPTTPIFISRASYAFGEVSENVIDAQNQIIEDMNNVYAGPNTDVYGKDYRFDNIHFNDKAIRLIAGSWIKILKGK
jgi:hypothetical protein